MNFKTVIQLFRSEQANDFVVSPPEHTLMAACEDKLSVIIVETILSSSKVFFRLNPLNHRRMERRSILHFSLLRSSRFYYHMINLTISMLPKNFYDR